MMYQCPRCHGIKSDDQFMLSKTICTQCSHKLPDTIIRHRSRIETLMENAPDDVQKIISENIMELL